MMIEEIKEPVTVVAVFSRSTVAPRLFTWRQRNYPVSRVTASWSDYEGEARRLFFSVITDGANLYELCFHTRSLRWDLLRIYHE